MPPRIWSSNYFRNAEAVYSYKESWKRITESNGTPAMDLGHMHVVLKWCMCMSVLVLDFGNGMIIIIISIYIIIMFFYSFPKLE